MHCSHTPPLWEPVVGLKVHLTLHCSRKSRISLWFQLLIASCSSFSPLTKFPPLPERISSGRPLLATNLHKALINDSVSSELTTLMWTARRAKHVKMTPYLFTLDRPRRTSKGSKQSLPVNVKGGVKGILQSIGRSAVFCWPVGDWCFLQVRHFSSILHTADLAFMVQYLWRMRDRVYSMPGC